ncbi:MAG: YebC/PmpR family DNA-binding transcriptional regulator [Deltaproteobacteria bacterium]|nr:MAG: YebC/PmpR family DNA-binding transcriptional regulator [Deltaproteobacteria bacterium]
MAGHSKWANIKHKKGREDAKRGKIFTKLIKEITVAAKIGGGDTESNPRLRAAVDAAKNANMPKDNIERGIKKGTGELEGVSYEEIQYEGYGPGGAAVFVESLTDNKNRAVAEIRHIFSKHDGNLGENGCVAWMFDKKGYIVVSKDSADEETIMDIALEAGAEDIKEQDDSFEVICLPSDFENVKKAIEEAEIAMEVSEITMLPENETALEGRDAEKMVKLIDGLEDCDDVQNVYTNADIPDSYFE